MKLSITILLYFVCLCGFTQQKSIGPIALSANMNATITLDNGTSLVTLSLSGPNNRWFAMQFGSFTGGMEAGADLVYWNNVTLVDARHNGVGISPTTDASNDWTLVSNTNNSPTTGLRTLVYTRPFNTGDANDFTFNFADTTLDLAWARSNTASFTLAYHEVANRGVFLDNFYTLGVNEFTLADSVLYPNPNDGSFSIEAEIDINEINIYNISGVIVKSIKLDNNSRNAEIEIYGMHNGVYFLELRNDTEKAWKKVILK